MLKASLLNFTLFCLFDAIWWGLIMKGFFKKEMGHLARIDSGSVNIYYPSAVGVYVLMSFLLSLFVVFSERVNSITDASLYGAILGLGLFVTFDFTNHALIDKYPIKFALVDTAWGTLMCGAVAAITYRICVQ